MFPELVRLGALVIPTSGVLSVLAFLVTAFVFWRKAREEHYHEEQVFDAFLLAVLMGLVVGRVGFVLLHLTDFVVEPWRAIDVIGHAGHSLEVGLAGATLYLYQYAQRRKWDAFEVLDFWFLAVAAGLVLVQIGNFLAGVGFGNETSLPWGVVFPGVFTKHHPIQLYLAVVLLVLHKYLGWAEYHYRTFMWYRAGKKSAQTGYLTSVFMIIYGLFSLLAQLLMSPQVMVGTVSFDTGFSAVALVVGLVLLYARSGRSFRFWRKPESHVLPGF